MPLGKLQVSLTSNPFSEQQPRNLPRMEELPVKNRECRAQGLFPLQNLGQGPWAALLNSREERGLCSPHTGAGHAAVTALSVQGNKIFHKEKQLILSYKWCPDFSVSFWSG